MECDIRDLIGFEEDASAKRWFKAGVGTMTNTSFAEFAQAVVTFKFVSGIEAMSTDDINSLFDAAAYCEAYVLRVGVIPRDDPCGGYVLKAVVSDGWGVVSECEGPVIPDRYAPELAIRIYRGFRELRG